MRKSRFTEEQIVGVLREHEHGAATEELCRRLGIATETLYNWKRKYGGLAGRAAGFDKLSLIGRHREADDKRVEREPHRHADQREQGTEHLLRILDAGGGGQQVGALGG